jgi:hypothetical protein
LKRPFGDKAPECAKLTPLCVEQGDVFALPSSMGAATSKLAATAFLSPLSPWREPQAPLIALFTGGNTCIDVFGMLLNNRSYFLRDVGDAVNGCGLLRLLALKLFRNFRGLV